MQSQATPIYELWQEVTPQAVSAADPVFNYVYLMLDPRDKRVRYVGITNNPATRLTAPLTNGSQRMQGWVQRLAGDGVVPVMVIAEMFRNRGAYKGLERKWVYRCKYAGCDLINVLPHASGRMTGLYTNDGFPQGVPWKTAAI
jgi:hypothetical protein